MYLCLLVPWMYVLLACFSLECTLFPDSLSFSWVPPVWRARVGWYQGNERAEMIIIHRFIIQWCRNYKRLNIPSILTYQFWSREEQSLHWRFVYLLFEWESRWIYLNCSKDAVKFNPQIYSPLVMSMSVLAVSWCQMPSQISSPERTGGQIGWGNIETLVARVSWRIRILAGNETESCSIIGWNWPIFGVPVTCFYYYNEQTHSWYQYLQWIRNIFGTRPTGFLQK